ncbi:MAG TPA: aminotransferase class III-fold pyridoxal phosphate-dependent enzyme, partial [Actinomycetota bacterium]|nr:aminotransferase class III-fold pyridoxal phosphate-dependent enzyme [Actinomycetota bacterium]
AVRTMGALLRREVERLAPAGTLAEARGRGLLLGFETAPGVEAAAVVEGLRDRGVLASTAGPATVRFTPPFTIAADDVDVAAKAMAGALAGAAA